MATSKLTRLESMGILEKLYDLNRLDEYFGIIKEESGTLTDEAKNGLNAYANGAYDDKFGFDIMDKFMKRTWISIISARREGGKGIFSASVSGLFDVHEFEIIFPREEY